MSGVGMLSGLVLADISMDANGTGMRSIGIRVPLPFSQCILVGLRCLGGDVPGIDTVCKMFVCMIRRGRLEFLLYCIFPFVIMRFCPFPYPYFFHYFLFLVCHFMIMWEHAKDITFLKNIFSYYYFTPRQKPVFLFPDRETFYCY